MSLENTIAYCPKDKTPVIEKKQISFEVVRYHAKPETSQDEKSACVTLYWDWVNREWRAKVSGEYVYWTNPEDGKQTIWAFTKGPFTLNEDACRKLMEAYNIPKARLKLSLVPKTSPKKLERLGEK